MHGGARDHQDYQRTEAQQRNIEHQKRKVIGGRFVMPKTPPPADSWWTCPDAEFSVRHAQQLPRMTAVTSTYRYSNDEGI